MFHHAITRKPGENFSQGLTKSNLGVPDFKLALEQHSLYCQALARCNLKVTTLQEEPQYPDAPFVEDTAVITNKIAVITYPGATSRRGEVKSIEKALARFKKTAAIIPPGTLDGGDVMRVEQHFFIGISERTNETGALQLGKILSAHGCTWEKIRVTRGLHLKEFVNYLGDNTLLVASSFVDCPELKKFNKIVVADNEAYAANCLAVNDHILIAKGFPKVKKDVAALGKTVLEIDVSEFRKMDGGLTCLSLLF